jgi:hypothetical protein
LRQLHHSAGFVNAADLRHIPTIPPLDRISIARDADLIVEIAPHAA